MAEENFYKSAEHQQRFLACMLQIGKIDDGKLDPEYASAVYIFSADLAIWNKAKDYIDRDGINIAIMRKEVDFSGGYGVLVQLAGNLFNGEEHIDPLELLRLDEGNFRVALTALKLRRYSALVSKR